MFNLPGKDIVSLTDKASAQILKLMQKSNHKGLKIGVKKGGCAGMEYTMEYVDEIDSNDEIQCLDCSYDYYRLYDAFRIYISMRYDLRNFEGFGRC